MVSAGSAAPASSASGRARCGMRCAPTSAPSSSTLAATVTSGDSPRAIVRSARSPLYALAARSVAARSERTRKTSGPQLAASGGPRFQPSGRGGWSAGREGAGAAALGSSESERGGSAAACGDRAASAGGSGGLGRLKDIPVAPHRADVARVAQLLELAAQAQDVDVQHVRLGVGAVAPDLVRQE